MGEETLFSQEALQEDVLVHYGVKGMRWGIRKDRSSGGTKKKKKKGLLESIRNTYKAKEKAAKAKEKAAVAEAEAKRVSSFKSSSKRSVDYKSLSDEDLRRVVQRMSLEKQYRQLSSEGQKGKMKFSDALKKVGIGATKATAIIGAFGGAKALGEKYDLTDKQIENLENTLKVIEILAK